MGHFGIQKKTTSGTTQRAKTRPIGAIKDPTAVKLEAAKSDTCPRCGGFMVSHWCMNVNYDAGGMEILTQRCLLPQKFLS